MILPPNLYLRGLTIPACLNWPHGFFRLRCKDIFVGQIHLQTSGRQAGSYPEKGLVGNPNRNILRLRTLARENQCAGCVPEF